MYTGHAHSQRGACTYTHAHSQKGTHTYKQDMHMHSKSTYVHMFTHTYTKIAFRKYSMLKEQIKNIRRIASQHVKHAPPGRY